MNVVTLPGDGVGPEVMREAVKVVRVVAPDVTLTQHQIGRAALVQCGEALPRATIRACKEADAVLMGAVGSLEFDSEGPTPEDGMFDLRRELGVYANLRPFSTGRFDLLIVRELLGGLYYGQRGVRPDGTVYDTCEYHPSEVERVVRRAFEFAQSRRRGLTSVDKANVLACSRMWRHVVVSVAHDYPEVQVRHLLVDTAAMQLIQSPDSFDVLVTENTFGDILSDVAAAMSGGIGRAASASLGSNGPGLFEPVHGSAPDIAGRSLANPTGMIRSAAMMLKLGLGLSAEADMVDKALDEAVGLAPTPESGGAFTTEMFGDVVVDRVALLMEANNV
jgi:3-isopropylmalate dehydrogenase